MYWKVRKGLYPAMRGMMVTFLDEGQVWVQFRYKGLPNYCFYCGKLGHVSRVWKTQLLRGKQGMEEGEAYLGQGGLCRMMA